LIDAAEEVNGPPPKFPKEVLEVSIDTPATLVVVPAHLMGQWPEEVRKFTGRSKNVVVIKDMSSFNNLTVDEVKAADLVIVNFTVLSNDKYHERLARLAGANAGSLPGSKRGGRHFDAVYGECVAGIENRCDILRKNRALAYERIEKDAFNHWNEEQIATKTGLGMRLDRKKSVYKKVSEEKTKVEVVVEEAFVEKKQKRWGAVMSEEEAKALAEENSSSMDIEEEEEEEDEETVRKCKIRDDPMHKKMKDNDRDPWGLKTESVQKDLGEMKCPPLELFCWNRVVIDEFHYLSQKQDRARVLTLILGLKSNYRWCLSGTPPHGSFDDVSSLAKLLGIHLGVNDTGVAKGGRGSGSRSKAADKDKTSTEKFSDMLDVKSTQWHMRRHDLSQVFLDRFVRQNIAEIDEIPQEEHINKVTLPPAERAIYLELETHLKSLEMNSQKAKKSKKSSKGDREKRMQQVLEDSADAEEALLKRCSHFDLAGNSQTAIETCQQIIKTREEQKEDCIKDLVKQLSAAIRQRMAICKIQKGWEGTEKESDGEVNDRLKLYENDVADSNCVSGGADEEIHELLKKVLKDAHEEANKDPNKKSSRYSMANVNENIDYQSDEEDESKKKKVKEPKDKRPMEEIKYAMKYALREHVHQLRTLNKELAGRIRSLRYFNWVLKFNEPGTMVPCNGTKYKRMCCPGPQVPAEKAGVLSSCGHAGSLACLEQCAAREECIDPTCRIPTKTSNIVSGISLGCNLEHKAGGVWGTKLTTICKNIKGLVADGDRVLVFVQFKDLKEKVAEALESVGVKTLQVKGTVQNQIKALSVMQKEVPSHGDPKCLLLTMDDESSSGVNLTHANHAVFVHPLLAGTQQLYDAYETQAIGRVRRFGQKKTVHIHRYICSETIDSDIWEEKGVSGYKEREEILRKSREKKTTE